MISRYLVITLAFGAAIYRAGQGAVVEAAGLAALGAGLLLLRLAPRQRAVRSIGYACLVIAAISIVVVLART